MRSVLARRRLIRFVSSAPVAALTALTVGAALSLFAPGIVRAEPAVIGTSCLAKSGKFPPLPAGSLILGVGYSPTCPIDSLDGSGNNFFGYATVPWDGEVCGRLTAESNNTPAFTPPAGHSIQQILYTPQCSRNRRAFDFDNTVILRCDTCARGVQTRVTAVVNAASLGRSAALPWGKFADGIALEFSGAVFGSNLTNVQQGVQPLPPPGPPSAPACSQILANRSVVLRSFDSRQEMTACLTYAGPSQINFYLPRAPIPFPVHRDQPGILFLKDVAKNEYIPINSGTYTDYRVPIRAVQAGLFSTNSYGEGLPSGYVVRVAPDESQTIQAPIPQPLKPPAAGEKVYLVLYGTGIRNRTPASPIAAYLGGDTRNDRVEGGTRAEVVYAGAAPVYGPTGVDQITVRLPEGVTGDNLYLRLFVDDQTNASVEGRWSNVLSITIR